MLAEASGIDKIALICGYTDLRYGIDGLAQRLGTKYNINPFQKNVLFLFCGIYLYIWHLLVTYILSSDLL